MKDYLDQNPDVHFVDKDTFYTCYHKIRPRLDTSILVGYLMKYNMVRDSDRIVELTSPYLKPQDKITSLLKTAEEAGPNGFMLLYMCLKESGFESPGHEAAVIELQKEGTLWDSCLPESFYLK